MGVLENMSLLFVIHYPIIIKLLTNLFIPCSSLFCFFFFLCKRNLILKRYHKVG